MDRTKTLLTAPAAPEPPPAARPDRHSPPTRRSPAWARPALAILLLATGLLYLWGLGASDWANSFYAAAVQAGSASTSSPPPWPTCAAWAGWSGRC